MKIIAVISQKGGAGKTTTAANIAYAIGMLGHKVAAVDFDPQAHLTACLGFAGHDGRGIGDLILHNAEIATGLLTAGAGLKLLPPGRTLKQLEGNVQNIMSVDKFCSQLRSLFQDRQYVFIDCPPASGTILNYALSVTNQVLVPVAADYLALRSLSDLVVTLREYRERRRREISQTIAVTRFHGKRRLCHEVREKLAEYFPGQVLATPIRETAALAESPGFGKTVFEYKRNDNGARDYQNLANDFIQMRYM